ncbi:MAG: HAD-IA family hydrolase [Acidimicrobiales bacterium]|nr:HAD-IA family hydrolase [Acidimicrobiales bacterium]
MGGSDVKAVLWDFGGVLTSSPFDAFSSYEAANGLEPGLIRRLNSTNPDTNAWARLERNQVTAAEFATLFEAEAAAAGASIDAAMILSALRGELRPSMVEAVRRCHERLKTGLLTNNFVPSDSEGSALATHRDVLEHFDVVVESSKVGHRKPDPRFYELACHALAIEPHQAVFLDDLGINLKPARAMGMRTIKVNSPEEALADLEVLVGFPLA